MSKAISDLVFPDDVRYTDDHEWARQEGETVKVGITDYAQDQLGDIVFVELPEVGSTVEQGEEFGTLESVKAVSELYMPIGGEIVAINDGPGGHAGTGQRRSLRRWLDDRHQTRRYR